VLETGEIELEEMALFCQSKLCLGAPDCPVVHRQCPVHQAGSGELVALWKKLTAYGYNSSDCPVCTGQCPVCTRQCPVSQRSAGPTVGRAVRAGHVAEPTPSRGHRTVRCAPDSVRCANGSKAPTVGLAK
jgi:hypothetical protein